jgi:hypothetical protein
VPEKSRCKWGKGEVAGWRVNGIGRAVLVGGAVSRDFNLSTDHDVARGRCGATTSHHAWSSTRIYPAPAGLVHATAGQTSLLQGKIYNIKIKMRNKIGPKRRPKLERKWTSQNKESRSRKHVIRFIWSRRPGTHSRRLGLPMGALLRV